MKNISIPYLSRSSSPDLDFHIGFLQPTSPKYVNGFWPFRFGVGKGGGGHIRG